MQLKHKGNVVEVTLTKTETRQLERAADILAGIALIPGENQDAADETAARVGDIIAAMGKPDAPVVESVETEDEGTE